MQFDKKSITWGVTGLAIGLLAMYLLTTKTTLFHNATGSNGSTGPVLRKGDKGTDVLELQKNINVFFGLDGASVPETGMFDKATAKAVGEVFQGTHALIDPMNGTLDKYFVSDFNTLINREKGN